MAKLARGTLPTPQWLGRRLTLMLMATSLVAYSHGTAAADSVELSPITVTSVRASQGRPLSVIPGSVTVIEREEIQEQTRTTRDIGEILSNLVPGIGQSSQGLTNFGQRLRGRNFLVMIDGVPQNAVLRQAFKHLRGISHESVERIEIIRGAVATYGIGSTGGIINFLTKSGEGIEGTELQSSAGIHGQGEDTDSLGGRVYQGLRGSTGGFDYSVNLSAERRGSWYDGNDNRIPPDAFFSQGGGLSESRQYNLHTKLGYRLSRNQRLQLSVNYFDHIQDADHRTDRESGDPVTDDPTEAIDEEPPGADMGTENLNLSLDHTWRDFLGGTLSSQVYFQDYETIFGFFEFTSGPGQTFLETRHIGGRLAHDRSIGGLANAVYGIDVGTEETAQNFLDGRTSIGELDQFNYAPFLQLEVSPWGDLLLKGGVRHERVQVEVPTFQDQGVPNPGTVRGGELDYSETVFNLGAVYSLTLKQEVFAGFSQGFTVADIGRALRTQSQQGRDIDAETFDPEAKVVDNFEVGWRGRFEGWRASVTAFFNTSDVGATFGGPPDFLLRQRKEEVYGVEASADVEATRSLTLGGTGSWQEGRFDSDNDGEIDRDLPGTRISAPELTGYAEYQPIDWWSVRAQVKHLFDRDEFGDSTAFGEGEINGFTVVDLSARVDVGPGTLNLGVGNVLDEQYITPLGQASNFEGFVVAGRGRSFNLGYTVTY